MLAVLVIPRSSTPSELPLFVFHIKAGRGDHEEAKPVFDFLFLGEAVVSLIVDLEVFVLSHHRGVDDLDRLQELC